MMWFIKFLQKRPSDMTIMIGRMLFGMILIASLYYNLIVQWDKLETNFFWMEVPTEYITYIKYAMIALWVVPLIMWVLNICLLKKKYMRIIQIFFWITLFYISSKIISPDANKLDVDALIWFMWVLPLVAWITGKCISSKCLKHWETITKIRV